MRRYTFIVLIALGAMMTAMQLVTAQSARNADFDANGMVDFGDFILFAQAHGPEAPVGSIRGGSQRQTTGVSTSRASIRAFVEENSGFSVISSFRVCKS